MTDTESYIERFWENVEKTSSCWIWKAGQDGKGYGRLTTAGKSRQAYRFAYELLVGEVPKNMCLDHLCRNRVCVNPAHLEVVTQTENKRRGIGFAGVNARKTHCDHGHEFTEQNTYYQKGNPSWRGCLTCRHRIEAEQALKWRDKNLARAKAKRREHKIKCETCGELFYPTRATQRNCGSKKAKMGCSYLRTLKNNYAK